MSFLKNKLLIGSLCIVLGLALAFAGIPRMYGESVKTTPQFIAKADITPGTVISTENIEQVEIPESLSVENAVTGNVAIGQYAIHPIYKGDVITTAKITAEYFPDDTYKLASEKEKVVVSMSIRNLAASAAARIKAGDVVSVYALPQSARTAAGSWGLEPSAGQADDENEDEDEEQPTLSSPTEKPKTVVYPELKYIEVAAVIANTGAYAQVHNELVDEQENSLPTTVSFYATEEQALRLTEIEMNGQAQIAFVAREEAAYKYIPREEKILHLGESNQKG